MSMQAWIDAKASRCQSEPCKGEAGTGRSQCWRHGIPSPPNPSNGKPHLPQLSLGAGPTVRAHSCDWPAPCVVLTVLSDHSLSICGMLRVFMKCRTLPSVIADDRRPCDGKLPVLMRLYRIHCLMLWRAYDVTAAYPSR